MVFHTGLTGTDPWTVTFNARNSTDADWEYQEAGDKDKLKVEWNWGDGSSTETHPALTGETGDGSVTHRFHLAAGQTTAVYQVRATVRDFDPVTNQPRGGEAVWSGWRLE